MGNRYTKSMAIAHFERLAGALGRRTDTVSQYDSDGHYITPPVGTLRLDQGNGLRFRVEEYQEFTSWQGDRHTGQLATTVSPTTHFGMDNLLNPEEFCDAVNFTIGCLELLDPEGSKQRNADYYQRVNAVETAYRAAHPRMKHEGSRTASYSEANNYAEREPAPTAEGVA